MSNRTLLYFTLIVLIGMGFLLVYNTFSTLGITEGRFLNGNEVRGMALEVKGSLWTLNFDQQKKVLSILNKASTVLPNTGESSPRFIEHAGFERLVVYRFLKEPDLVFTPIGYIQGTDGNKDNLEFEVEGFPQKGPYRERSNGELKQILEAAYDRT